MKNIVFTLMIIASFGCQTASISSPEKESKIQTEAEENSDNTSVDNLNTATATQTSNPGEVTFKIAVLEDFTSGKEICGVSKKNVYKIRVDEIIEKGLGISHMPHATNELLVSFLFLNEQLTIGSKLEVKAKETLCLDASKSHFTIISHKILE